MCQASADAIARHIPTTPSEFKAPTYHTLISILRHYSVVSKTYFLLRYRDLVEAKIMLIFCVILRMKHHDL